LDETDGRILAAIADRFEIITEIARHKGTHGIPMMQPDRVSFVHDRFANFGAHLRIDGDLGLNGDHFGRIADELIAAACELELAVMARASAVGSGDAG
jgi:chorismate mutase